MQIYCASWNSQNLSSRCHQPPSKKREKTSRRGNQITSQSIKFVPLIARI